MNHPPSPGARQVLTLVYSAKGMDARHVWVDGRQVVRDRRPLLVNGDEVRDQIARIWRRLKPRGN